MIDTGLDKAVDLLDDLSYAVDYSIIGPRDNRVQVKDPGRFPYNTLCFLERHFGDGRWRKVGTGTLVGPKTVLTAGHCIYNHRLKRAAAEMRVSPGRDGKSAPFGTKTASRCYVPLRYIQSPRHADRMNFDYGVITLARPFHGINPFMALKDFSDAEMAAIKRERLVTIAGYPGDKAEGTQWRHTERMTKIFPAAVRYTVDTCPGQSGSPIWFFCPRVRRRFIIGVHTSGPTDEQGRPYGCFPAAVRGCRSNKRIYAPAGATNRGVRITADVLADIAQPASSARMMAV